MRLIVLFFTFLLLAASSWAQGNEKAELERRKRQTLQEIDILNRQYNEIKKNKKESLGQLAMIQQKIRLRNQVIENINRQVRVINKDIDYSYREMRRLQKDLDTLKMNYAQNAVYAYKNRSRYDFLNFLFSATNFNDAIRRISYMRAYRNYRMQQVEAIIKTEELYRQKITQLTNNRKEKSAALLDQNKEMGELVKDKKEQDQVVNNLKKREKEINTQIAAKKKQATQLDAAIKAVVRREIELAKKEAERRAREERERLEKEKAKTTPETTTGVTKPVNTPKKEEPVKKQESYLEYNREDMVLGSSFESSKGRLPFPVDNGYIKTGFGSYTVPGTTIKGYQEFITIASPVGTTVKAVFDGEVVSVAEIGTQMTVTIRHGKYFTLYSNLSSISVSKGQNVKAGQGLGRVATDMDGDGSIEFILTKEFQNLNPQLWLRSR